MPNRRTRGRVRRVAGHLDLRAAALHTAPAHRDTGYRRALMIEEDTQSLRLLDVLFWAGFGGFANASLEAQETGTERETPLRATCQVFLGVLSYVEGSRD